MAVKWGDLDPESREAWRRSEITAAFMAELAKEKQIIEAEALSTLEDGIYPSPHLGGMRKALGWVIRLAAKEPGRG